MKRYAIRRRHNDGILDIAKTGLKIITLPLKIVGRTGARILKICADAVKFLMFLKTTHDAYSWINARDTLKQMHAKLNWSQDIIKKSLDAGLHDVNIQFGIKLIKNAVVMALAEVTSRLTSKASKALNW